MKPILLSFIFFITTNAFSQFNRPDEKLVIEKKIQEYKIINRAVEGRKSDLDNRVMFLQRFNKEGKLVYEYTFNIDVIYTIDSTVYQYDEKGNLTEKLNYYIGYPLGQSQLDFLKEMDTQADTTLNHFKYFYNKSNQLVQVDQIKFSKPVISKFTNYDSLGRISKVAEEYYSLPEQNDHVDYYFYNKQGQLAQIKSIYPKANDRVDLMNYAYDKDGKLLREEKKGMWVNSLVENTYDEKGKLSESVKKVIDRNSKITTYVTSYSYDSKGNLKEEKEKRGKEIYSWKKFAYNNQNIITEEFWMNEKTGKRSSSILYEYVYFK